MSGLLIKAYRLIKERYKDYNPRRSILFNEIHTYKKLGKVKIFTEFPHQTYV